MWLVVEAANSTSTIHLDGHPDYTGNADEITPRVRTLPNTLHAAVGNRAGPEQLTPGARVTGAYLGQPFSARIVGVQALTSAPGSYRVSLDLDEAVDVVTFDSFSSFRKRVNGVIGKEGVSRERTSNGRPQLELSWS
ncbi:hypothetical protein HPDFL43_15902 [Hoeflea phototrophica DFL-43]|uniref:Glyoxalase-related protein domain-containing protein n=1 Tax=Hoeflea phototrophica (strain DSM 17068 / NCIMB 14078 / DFL-43) TaxID=411684 RepID=A9D1T9_HOEPD|nr:glyoxalase superfamily protein [Hoeflea phototrophica]EDQ34496.1 hypothetical protein HPDFL43_15902 [Hoeflea phototrophica DFL-43]